MNIAELMAGIRKMDIILPEFQREFVWDLEQSKQLMVSLVRKYPTGSLLFWKTENPPEIKNSAVDRKRLGSKEVILDGQQRLTALHLLTQNEIPPYYTKRDIKYDPRHLYFNLETGEFQYYRPLLMKNNPVWMEIIDCFNPDNQINVFEIAKQISPEGGNPFELAQQYTNNLTKLKNILDREYPVQYVPPDASIDDAIDVFDRVNSQGTKLTDAELALTHITGKWPHAMRIMKEKIQELEGMHFYFDTRDQSKNLAFLVRCLVGIVEGSGLFKTLHKTPESKLKEGWKNLEKILSYLVAILPKHAFINSTEDLNSTNTLVPLVVYLSRNGNRFPNERSLNNAIHWLYAAHIWGRYTGQTDQRIDSDVTIVDKNSEPWKELIDAIIDQRGRIEVKPSDLEGRIIQHPLYRMLHILVKSNGAVDWLNGIPLDTRQSGPYSIQSHHIFPTSRLRKEGGYDAKNYLHKQIMNEIANRAFLTADTNIIEISDRLPKEYFPEIERRFPGALEGQFIPMDESLWEIDRYEDFLKKRREMIAEKINVFMNQLLQETEAPRAMTLDDFIGAGEKSTVEFKSSLRWDIRNDRVNKDLEKVIVITIAGFMNSESGTLLIGVMDNGSIFGIESDLKTLKKGNIDGFQQTIVSLISDYLGTEFTKYAHIDFEEKEEQTICKITIERSPQPVFFKASDGSAEFHIRAGNTTRRLDTRETHEYIQMQWEA
jgi:hypothetical protein